MARKFILDSLKYWVDEYKVDGFRFDLMGLNRLGHHGSNHQRIAPNRSEYFAVMAEPWAAGQTPIGVTAKGKQRGCGFGRLNDNFRNALKGQSLSDRPTFLVDGERIDQVNKVVEVGSATLPTAP